MNITLKHFGVWKTKITEHDKPKETKTFKTTSLKLLMKKEVQEKYIYS
jgi:hypothetical protein